MNKFPKEQECLFHARSEPVLRLAHESELDSGHSAAVALGLPSNIYASKISRNRMSEIYFPSANSSSSSNKNIGLKNLQVFHSPGQATQDSLLKKGSSPTPTANLLEKKRKKSMQSESCFMIKAQPQPNTMINRISQILTRYERNIASKKCSLPLNGKDIRRNSEQSQLSHDSRARSTKQQLFLKETISTVCSRSKPSAISIQDFELGSQLGCGKSGSVRIAGHRKTGMIFSIKTVRKSVILRDNMIQQFIKEVTIQAFLNHRNIVKLYSVFDDQLNIYLLLEMCPDGNLYSLIQKSGKIPEGEAGMIMRYVCEGVYQLHLNQVIHRDIKPENIVMCFGVAKICDFGWSTSSKSSMRETFCGTPLYISPELLKGSLYDQKIDLWALGILGYEMITGSVPFAIRSEKDLGMIISSEIIYSRWLQASTVDFLKCLLNKSPEGRKSLASLLTHPFLSLE